jgi:hypothetical protein
LELFWGTIMSYTDLTETDAARLSRWASIGGDNVLDSWGTNDGEWLTGTSTPVTGVYEDGPEAAAGRAFSTVASG